MDHVKKLVYTIVGFLTIVSLTFTICTKIGHCAEVSSSTFSEYPLPFGYEHYGIQAPDVSDITNHLQQAGYTIPNYTGYCFYYGEHYNSGTYNGLNSMYLVLYSNSNPYVINKNSPAISNSDQLNYGNNIVGISYGTTTYSVCAFRCYDDGTLFTGSQTVFFPTMNWQPSVLNFLDINPNGTYSLKSSMPFYYPVRSSGDLVSDTGIIIFGSQSLPPFSGHTKGGVLSNYIDSDDLISNDSSLPTVDTTAPSDPNSNSGWFQKILNGLSKINQSIKGGVLTIGDYIGQLKEILENFIAWVTEPPDNEEILDNVEPYLIQNDLISGFLSSKTAIQGVYNSIGNVTVKTRSQMVWDIPFNLPSMSQTFHAVIDFGWYENIRSTFEPFLNMFLCIGFLFSFIRSIPGILHGNSGEGDT